MMARPACALRAGEEGLSDYYQIPVDPVLLARERILTGVGIELVLAGRTHCRRCRCSGSQSSRPV